MKALAFLLLILLAGPIRAQTRTVTPDDAVLTLSIEGDGKTPYSGEMVLVTLTGIYRRHVTLPGSAGCS